MSPVRRLIESLIQRCDHWYRSDNWWLGKLIELRGNSYTCDGLTFSLDNPRIATRLKSRFFRGDYELDERRMLAQHLEPELPAIEVGACIGVLSCMTNRILKKPEQHVVVEANPYLIPTLEANRDRNGCRFKVLNRALAYGKPHLAFSLHDLFVGGSVQRQTSEQVEVVTTTVREILDDHGFDVVNLIVDAEGAEVDLLKHEAELLKTRVALLIVEVHARIVGEPVIISLIEEIKALGFTLVDSSGITLYDSACVFVNHSIRRANTDVYAADTSGGNEMMVR